MKLEITKDYTKEYVCVHFSKFNIHVELDIDTLTKEQEKLLLLTGFDYEINPHEWYIANVFHDYNPNCLSIKFKKVSQIPKLIKFLKLFYKTKEINCEQTYIKKYYIIILCV